MSEILCSGDNDDKNRRCNTIGNISNDELIKEMANEAKKIKPINIKNFSNFKISEMDEDKNQEEHVFKFNRKLARLEYIHNGTINMVKYFK